MNVVCMYSYVSMTEYDNCDDVITQCLRSQSRCYGNDDVEFDGDDDYISQFVDFESLLGFLWIDIEVFVKIVVKESSGEKTQWHWGCTAPKYPRYCPIPGTHCLM